MPCVSRPVDVVGAGQGWGGCLAGRAVAVFRQLMQWRVFGGSVVGALAQPTAQADRQMAARLSCFINFGGAICRPLSYYVGPRLLNCADRPTQACKVLSGQVSIGLRLLRPPALQGLSGPGRFTFGAKPGSLSVISFSRAAMIFAAVIRSNPSLKRTLNGGVRWLASAGFAAPLRAA